VTSTSGLTIFLDGFFSKNASEGQKFRGFLITQQTLQAFGAKGSLPPAVFSAKLMSSLMNQAAKEDRYLHRAALKPLKTLENLTAENPDLVLPALKGLLGRNGDFAFDLRTHTKTVDRIVGRIKPEDEKKAVKFLRKQLVASLG
jgi:DNA polymerase phi